MDKIIEIKNVSKSYGDVIAVDELSLSVEKGQLYAFLGVNGAGKSTTIDMLSTRLSIDKGTIKVNGYQVGIDDAKIRNSIGIVFQNGVLDDLLTVRENLYLRGKMYGLSKSELTAAIENALEVVEAHEFADRYYKNLSGGQKRRSDIARALINKPDILILDEPTTGLDPQTRLNLWKTIKKLQEESNLTVFLTTHYMEEATAADYVTIIGKGKVLASGTPQMLKTQYSIDLLKIKANDEKQLKQLLLKNNIVYKYDNERFIIEVENSKVALNILNLCSDVVDNFEVLNGSLDTVFINIANEEEISC